MLFNYDQGPWNGKLEEHIGRLLVPSSYENLPSRQAREDASAKGLPSPQPIAFGGFTAAAMVDMAYDAYEQALLRDEVELKGSASTEIALRIYRLRFHSPAVLGDNLHVKLWPCEYGGKRCVDVELVSGSDQAQLVANASIEFGSQITRAEMQKIAEILFFSDIAGAVQSKSQKTAEIKKMCLGRLGSYQPLLASDFPFDGKGEVFAPIMKASKSLSSRGYSALPLERYGTPNRMCHVLVRGIMQGEIAYVSSPEAAPALMPEVLRIG